MEDYEKKYKEALERMKSWVRGEHPECFSEAQKAAEFVFPELAESEEEKIRKALIDELKIENANYKLFNDIPKERFIAWLEKQKYTQRDVDDAYLKGVTDTKNILENREKQTTFFQNVSLTEFEEALADVCRGWIGEEIGWKDYIVRNANALLKICQKMWNEVQDAPFAQKPVESGDMAIMLQRAFGSVGKKTWGGIEVKDILTWLEMQDSQKPTTVWHDVSEIPLLYNEEQLLVEFKKNGNTWHYITRYDVDTRQFLAFGIPVSDVTRWAYVSDVLSQSVTKISEQVWSEEDEKELNFVIVIIESIAMSSPSEKYKDILYKSIDWLKSLKERLGGE